MLTCQTFCLQKKAKLAVLEQERAKARAKEAHLEKLQEEERKISEAMEETKKLSSEVMKRLCHSKPVKSVYYFVGIICAVLFRKSDTLMIPFKGHMCFFYGG